MLFGAETFYVRVIYNIIFLEFLHLPTKKNAYECFVNPEVSFGADGLWKQQKLLIKYAKLIFFFFDISRAMFTQLLK